MEQITSEQSATQHCQHQQRRHQVALASRPAVARTSPSALASTNPLDAALVRCIDFEREFSKLDTDAQTILLLAFREHQPQRVICQIARCSERALAYKIPAALAQLARLLDRTNML